MLVSDIFCFLAGGRVGDVVYVACASMGSKDDWRRRLERHCGVVGYIFGVSQMRLQDKIRGMVYGRTL